MSINLITLRRVKKKFNEFGMEKATLSDVVTLLTEIFTADSVNGEEKLRQFEDLLKCAKKIVDDKLRLQTEASSADLDEESFMMIQQSENTLTNDLFLFCETFNSICSSIGVVEYFSNVDGNTLWNEVITFFTEEN